MAPVEKAHAEAGLLHALRRLRVLFYGLEDHFLRHLRDRDAAQVRPRLGAAPDAGDGRVDLVAAQIRFARVHAGVHELHRGDRPVPGHGVRDHGEAADAAVVVQMDEARDVRPVHAVDISFADGDDGGAAARLQLVIRDGRLGRQALGVHMEIAGGCPDDPVPERDVPDPERGEQMGVFQFKHGLVPFFPFRCCRHYYAFRTA